MKTQPPSILGPPPIIRNTGVLGKISGEWRNSRRCYGNPLAWARPYRIWAPRVLTRPLGSLMAEHALQYKVKGLIARAGVQLPGLAAQDIIIFSPPHGRLSSLRASGLVAGGGRPHQNTSYKPITKEALMPKIEPCPDCLYDGDGECYCQIRMDQDKEREVELADGANEAHVNPQLLLEWRGAAHA